MSRDSRRTLTETIKNKGDKKMPIFKTIRQTAATGLLSEHRLRILVAKGECPGIYTGNRFLVNVTALSEQLETQSKKVINVDGK